jgi:Beta-propeller repeat
VRNRLSCLLLASSLAAFAQAAGPPSTPLTYFLGRGGRTPTPGGGPGSSPIPVYVQAVAAGPGGDIWVVGVAPGNTLPIVNAFQDEHAPDSCGTVGECAPTVVSRLRADGQGAVFSTYLSGSGWETVADLAVDEQGNAYLVGGTSSGSFPFTSEIPGDAPTEYRPFVVKLSPRGEIVYALQLPSTLAPATIAADRQGSAYIGGSGGEVEPIGGLGLEPDRAQLLRSDDGGQSWQFRDQGLPNVQFLAEGTGFVAAGHSGDVRLYALGESLYRSDDRGET